MSYILKTKSKQFLYEFELYPEKIIIGHGDKVIATRQLDKIVAWLDTFEEVKK